MGCNQCKFSEEQIRALKALAQEKLNELTPEEEAELDQILWEN